MTDSEILNILKEFERDFKNYKDSGSQEVISLSLYLNRLEKSEKKSFIDFLLREITSNENGYCFLGLSILVKSNQVTIAPELEKIYQSYFENKDEDWREEMIMAMLHLNYTKPHKLYESFINYNLANKTGRAFFLIVQYFRIDFIKGSKLLSDYYAKELISTKSYERNNFHHIGYLIYWSLELPYGSLAKIIKQTSKSNKQAGKYLKQIILDYLESKPFYTSRKKTEKIIENIKKI